MASNAVSWADLVEEATVVANNIVPAVRDLFLAAASAGSHATTEPTMENSIRLEDLERQILAEAKTVNPVIADFNEQTEQFKVFLDILSVRKNLVNVEEAMGDADDEDDLAKLGDEHDTLMEMADFLGWQFGNMVGYEYLAEMRKFWGVQTSMHNTLQERYYKAQKTRYEDCKRGKKFFTPEDRAFIEQNKALNELHMEARWKASACREIISDIIEAAFPDAPFDLGWDEIWEEEA